MSIHTIPGEPTFRDRGMDQATVDIFAALHKRVLDNDAVEVVCDVSAAELPIAEPTGLRDPRPRIIISSKPESPLVDSVELVAVRRSWRQVVSSLAATSLGFIQPSESKRVEVEDPISKQAIDELVKRV